ncbi:MAG TPA: GYF domain-containing protein [Pirellulaceae bacterium]|nr:GYF domain-containing protein [Pirellulaceae bacterium]HMP70769.1 GYF domain-containing protein [Pirellulaceae bacterium]
MKLRKLSRFHEVSSDNQLTWVQAGKIDWLFPNSGSNRRLATESVGKYNQLNSDVPAVEWYVAIGGDQAGPFETSEVIEMLRCGQVAHVDLAWNDSFDDWTSIEEIPEFANFVAQMASGDTMATRLVEPMVSQDRLASAGPISNLAICSVIAGVLLCFPLPIVAIVLSFAAIRSIHSNPSIQGKGIAIVGGVIGLLGLILNLIMIFIILAGAALGWFNL